MFDLQHRTVRKARPFVFTAFIVCCVSFSLIATAFATEFWFTADCYDELNDAWSGEVNYGLFTGASTLVGLTTVSHEYKIVCQNGNCIYSKNETENGRKESLQKLQNKNTGGLLGEGLWMTTVICLALALCFVVVEASFAVLNSVTTPARSIPGIPGLYLWNSLAEIFLLVSLSCWTEQYKKYMFQNMVVEESTWTTNGEESFGYSFWLVVTSVLLQALIFLILIIGTYEKKEKAQFQAPAKQPRDTAILF